MAKKQTEKKYFVAEGFSFTGLGMVFGPGDEIPTAVFTEKPVLASLIAKKQIIEKEVPVDSAEADAKAAEEAAKAEGTN